MQDDLHHSLIALVMVVLCMGCGCLGDQRHEKYEVVLGLTELEYPLFGQWCPTLGLL